MSDSRERTDRLLDEIDELVDASLSRGDQSGSWQGERYDRCPKCSEAWHFLPITRTMYEMRLGSYSQDEFGQGIVDPDYKYQETPHPFSAQAVSGWGLPLVTVSGGGIYAKVDAGQPQDQVARAHRAVRRVWDAVVALAIPDGGSLDHSSTGTLSSTMRSNLRTRLEVDWSDLSPLVRSQLQPSDIPNLSLYRTADGYWSTETQSSENSGEQMRTESPDTTP